MPVVLNDLVPTWRPQSELLALLAEGGRLEEISPAHLEGRSLVRIQVIGKDSMLRGIKERPAPVRRHEFYLDPDRGYAVRRLEIKNEAGHVVFRSDCTEHEISGAEPAEEGVRFS